MYNEFYGFKEKPFSLTPDPHFLYLSSVHKKALAYLTYGLEDRKGFITVTGEVGAGKTTLIRALMHRVDANTTIARIINTTISSLQMLKMIVRDFGIEVASATKEDILDALNTFLLKQYSQGHNAVIIIDEAQNLPPATLEEIRLLSNLETEKDKLLQILLVGQPELRQTLAQPELRQLAQRITVNYHISPLNAHEVSEYIRHRVKVAGIDEFEIFNQEAMQQIAYASKGIPRLVNIICDAALVIGYVEGTKTITEPLVKEVLTELNIPTDSVSHSLAPMQFENKSCPLPTNVNNILQQDFKQIYQNNSNNPMGEEEIRQKTKQVQEQIDQINIIMNRLNCLEKDLEEKARRIKQKEQELGL